MHCEIRSIRICIVSPVVMTSSSLGCTLHFRKTNCFVLVDIVLYSDVQSIIAKLYNVKVDYLICFYA